MVIRKSSLIKEAAVKKFPAIVPLLAIIVLAPLGFASAAENGPQAKFGVPPADIHAVVETTRTFRDMTRKSTEEFWSAPDKTLWKMDNFLWITRKDLGVLWGVNRREPDQDLDPGPGQRLSGATR